MDAVHSGEPRIPSSVFANPNLNPDRFYVAAMKGRLQPLPEQYTDLLKKLGEDSRFATIEETDELVGAVKELLRSGKRLGAAENVIGELHQKLNLNLGLDVVVPGVDLAPVKAKKPTGMSSYSSSSGGSYTASTKPASTIERITSQWKGLATHDQVSIGLSYILAAMTAVSAASRFRHATYQDEKGSMHVNMSNVMYGIVSTLLAAGMVYLGHSQYKAAVR